MRENALQLCTQKGQNREVDTQPPVRTYTEDAPTQRVLTEGSALLEEVALLQHTKSTLALRNAHIGG